MLRGPNFGSAMTGFIRERRPATNDELLK